MYKQGRLELIFQNDAEIPLRPLPLTNCSTPSKRERRVLRCLREIDRQCPEISLSLARLVIEVHRRAVKAAPADVTGAAQSVRSLLAQVYACRRSPETAWEAPGAVIEPPGVTARLLRGLNKYGPPLAVLAVFALAAALIASLPRARHRPARTHVHRVTRTAHF